MSNEVVLAGFVGKAREGKLFSPYTGEEITEAQAAGILKDLKDRIANGTLRPDQVAATLKDQHLLPDALIDEYKAALNQLPPNTELSVKLTELRGVMSQVEVALAAGDIQPSQVEAYIRTQFPAFQYDLKVLQDVFMNRYGSLSTDCAHSVSLEQLIGFLQDAEARISPTQTNEELIATLQRLVNDARSTDTQTGFISRALISGGFIVNKPDNPVLLAVHRLELTDRQIQARRQPEAAIEAPTYSLSLLIADARNIEVETDPRSSTELVKLTSQDGSNSVQIPLTRLQVALAEMEASTNIVRVGSSQDIDKFQCKYDAYSGQVSHLFIEGTDTLHNNTAYSLSITGEAMTKILNLLDPQPVVTIEQPDILEKDKSRASRIAKRMKGFALGLAGKNEPDTIQQRETSIEIPKPGLSSLRSSEHPNQDRI